MNTMARACLVTAALFVCVGLFGCKREPEPIASPTPAADTATNIPSPAAGEQLDTESGLAIKRGIVTVADGARRYRACGGDADWTLLDQSEGLLDRVYGELGGKALYIEAYGERSAAAAGAKPSFALEELLYASSEDPTAACSAPPTNFELLALGNDPTWSIEITPDSMILRQHDAPTEITFTEVDTSDTEGTVTYRAGVDKHVLELTVTQHACQDSGTGTYYGYSASVKFDKQTFNGCARIGG